MMELTCAFVFTLVCLVTATPHGYGVKGGASAKAEASAVAGSFGALGAVPLSVPSGTGYSGSFSKSSSSSFAQSSASSSASSSSFSFSGSGAGLTGFGSKGVGGCAFGNCQIGAADGTAPHGSSGAISGSQSLAGANAAAVAGTEGIGVTPGKIDSAPTDCVSGICQGGTKGTVSNSAAISGSSTGDYNKNINSNEKCTSGTCQKDVINGAINNLHNTDSTGNGQTYSGANAASTTGVVSESTKYPEGSSSCANGDCGGQKSLTCEGPACNNNGQNDNKKCISGQCGTSSQTNDDGSNDIHVNTAGSKTKYGSNGQSSSSEFGNSLSDCAYGNCGPSAVTSGSNPVYSHGSPTTYPGPSSSNSFPPHVPLTGTGAVPIFNTDVPATHLTTPKESTPTAPCNTPNCASPDLNIYSTKLPSSYNVPIQGSYPSTPADKGSSCSSGNCDFHQPSSYTPSNGNSLSTNYVNLPSGTKCTTPNCGLNTYHIDGSKAPSNSQIPLYQVVAGPSGISDCATGNCGVSPSLQASIPNSKIPNYSHGGSKVPVLAAGPINCVIGSPNCVGLTSTNGPSYTVLPSFNAPSHASGANTGATAGSGSLTGSFAIPKPNTPAVSSDTHKTPIYTGGFGGPSGVLKPNDYSVPSKPGYAQYQPTFNPHYSSGSVSVPNPPINIPSSVYPNKPDAPTTGSHSVPCTSGNCGSQSGFPSTQFGQSNAASGAQANAGAAANADTVIYTNGFGGPPGVLQPYDAGKIASGDHTGLNGQHLTGSQTGFHGRQHLAGSQTGSHSGQHVTDSQSGVYPSSAVTGGTTLGTNEANSGAQASAAAEATAAAGANSVSLDGSNLQDGKHINEHHIGGGCGGECGSNGGSYGASGAGGLNFGVGGGFGLSSAKTGILEGLGGVLNGANAAAKSVAGAISGATAGSGSFGLGGGFASSGAVAHASSGAATKGGYGR